MPRWQNLKSPHEEKFIRGYSIYPGGGCGEFPWVYRHIEGFGTECPWDLSPRRGDSPYQTIGSSVH